jgi:DNA repair photolyase
MRFEEKNTCTECGECKTGKMCDVVRRPLRNYNGIRFTADGFDCALPVSIDSHSFCSYGCLYCFSNYLVQHRVESANVGQTSLTMLERLFAGEPSERGDLFRKALRYDKKVNGYPCAVQLGALTDPMDNIERQQGWLLKFIDLAIKYNQPVRISTKGRLACVEEYAKAFAKAPHLFWVAFSIITIDDEILAKMDRRAPVPSERLKAMKALSDIGVKTSLRFRPMMPGISDATVKHPRAYAELIERSAEAGAKAVSYEVVFMPGMPTADIKKKWAEIEQLIGVPMFKTYKRFGENIACIRPSYTWTENIMHGVAEVSKKNGLVVAVSDPVWKQLGETGCCCGILPDDPVFGNWRRESATNQLLEAKWNGKEIGPNDITPDWAREQRLTGMCNTGPGPKNIVAKKYTTWADKLKEQWNDLSHERGPYRYFQGALVPTRRDEQGNVFYKYRGLERQNKKVPYWTVV